MKKYLGFHIPKICQTLKHFSMSFHQAYFWRVSVWNESIYVPKNFNFFFPNFFTAKYTSDSRLISEAHRSLADLYQAEYNKCSLENNQIDPFILEILPYHLSVLNDLKLLEETLCHLKFLQACALHPRLVMHSGSKSRVGFGL